MERVTELTAEPIVGNVYLVPCVKYQGMWLPIIGPPHDDGDYIGGAASERHYHVDVRFCTPRYINKKFKDRDRAIKWRGGQPLVCTPAEYAMQSIPYVVNIAAGPVEHRRKCWRRMPNFPLALRVGQSAPWLPKLEQVYGDAKLLCSRCPHKGFNLASMPVKNGKAVCPGHGLRWDIETGKLVTRL